MVGYRTVAPEHGRSPARAWRLWGLLVSDAGREVNEERLHAFVLATSDVVYRMSADWSQLHYVHGRGFVEDSEVPSGAWLDKYIAPEDQAQVKAAIAEAIAQKKKYQLEHRVRRVDGTLGWALSRAVPRLDANGEILEWVGTATDITASKQTEQNLREAVARYEHQVRLFDSVVSTTPDFVYLFDRQGRFLYANPRLLEVWGIKLADAVGKTCRELGYEQWHHDMHMREISEVISTRRPIKGEVPFKAPLTGIFGVYEYIFTPVLGAGGDVELIAGTTRDVTERKQAEERISEALKVRDDFLTIASHELKTPLATLLMSVQSSARLAAKDPAHAELERRLARASASGARLESLINQLLDVSRISAGRLQLEPELLRLGDVVRDVVERFEETAAKAGCPLEVRLDPSLEGRADRLRLEQIVTNLLSNAVKYGKGSPVAVTLERRAGRAVLSVTDHGIGIAAEQQHRIFERFERAVDAREYGGFGLGLWISKQLVELMGGAIRVESAAGQGATFVVEVPLEPAPAAAATAP